VDRENIPGEIDADVQNAYGLPLLRSVDESSNFPSWHFVADSRFNADSSGRGSSFHSFGVISHAIWTLPTL
jgi:hypothetical protein